MSTLAVGAVSLPRRPPPPDNLRADAIRIFGLKGPAHLDYTRSGMANRFEHKGVDAGCDEVFKNGSISYSQSGYGKDGVNLKKWNQNSVQAIFVGDETITRASLNAVNRFRLGAYEGADYTEIAMGNRNKPPSEQKDVGFHVLHFKHGALIVNEDGKPVRVRVGIGPRARELPIK